LGGPGSLGPPPGYALAQDLKKRFLTEKIRPDMPVLLSHAGIMPVTEKKKKNIITGFLVKFLLHPKLESYDLKFGFVQN